MRPFGDCVGLGDQGTLLLYMGHRNGSPVPARGSILPTPSQPIPSNQVQNCHILPFLSVPWAWAAAASALVISDACQVCSAFTLDHVTGPRPWPPRHRSQRVLVSTKAVCCCHLAPSEQLRGESDASSLFVPQRSFQHWVQHSAWSEHRRNRRSSSQPHRQKRGTRFHFLKGVSLLKVCQNRDGFLLGSARAKTCC